VIAGAVAFAALACFASKPFLKPEAKAANTYPAHDEHPTEHVTVAADPYDMADKASVFTIPFKEYGFLPIYLIVTNDGDQPVQLTNVQIQFATARGAKLSPATADDVYRRLSHPSTRGTSSPIPLPGKKVKGTVSKEAQDEIRDSQFAAQAVEPHATQSGFLFFDVSEISTPLPGAHLYLTGVRDSKGSELMYFEIAMEKYLTAPAAH
jgi:hypothetical protein